MIKRLGNIRWINTNEKYMNSFTKVKFKFEWNYEKNLGASCDNLLLFNRKFTKYEL